MLRSTVNGAVPVGGTWTSYPASIKNEPPKLAATMRPMASAEVALFVTLMMKSRQPKFGAHGTLAGELVSLTTYSRYVPVIVAAAQFRTPVSATMVPLGGVNASAMLLPPLARRPALAELA